MPVKPRRRRFSPPDAPFRHVSYAEADALREAAADWRLDRPLLGRGYTMRIFAAHRAVARTRVRCRECGERVAPGTAIVAFAFEPDSDPVTGRRYDERTQEELIPSSRDAFLHFDPCPTPRA